MENQQNKMKFYLTYAKKLYFGAIYWTKFDDGVTFDTYCHPFITTKRVKISVSLQYILILTNIENKHICINPQHHNSIDYCCQASSIELLLYGRSFVTNIIKLLYSIGHFIGHSIANIHPENFRVSISRKWPAGEKLTHSNVYHLCSKDVSNFILYSSVEVIHGVGIRSIGFFLSFFLHKYWYFE